MKLDKRFNLTPFSTNYPFSLEEIIEGEQDEICLKPVSPQIVPQLRCEENGDSLCSSCCHCSVMQEESESRREKMIPQVSLFYAPPSFLRDLCGVTAFAPAVFCSAHVEEHSRCQGLMIDFFEDVMRTYAERYSDLVFEIAVVFFSSLQSDLSVGSFSLPERLQFLQGAWDCYCICSNQKLISERDSKVFYGSLVMAITNLIVYSSQDWDVLLSVTP